MTTGKQSLASIQALRAAAALLVVLLHTAVSESKYGNPDSRFLEDFGLGAAGVDIFFVISGFIMMVTAADRAGSARAASVFLGKRLVRIYPTYWVYFALVAAAWVAVPGWVNASAGAPPDFMASFLLYPSTGTPLVMVAWTLEYELFFYLLFAGALLLGRRWLLPVLLGAIGTLVAMGVIAPPTSPVARMVLSPMMLEFGFGCVVGALYLKGKPRQHPSVAVASVLCGVSVLLAEGFGASWANLAGFGGTAFSRPFTFGLAGALLVYGLVALERCRQTRYPAFLLRLGDASYTLYLSHVLVLSAAGRLWQQLGLAVLPDVLLVCMLVGATTVFSLWGYRYIEEPLIHAGKRLFARSPQRPVEALA